jgi:uncharacterized membrane protein
MLMELLVLRLVHILGGIFWVGSLFFMTYFLTPAVVAAGAAGGKVMAGMQERRLMTIVPWVAAFTLLSGLRLMWLTSGGLAPGYFASSVGATYTLGGAAAIVAFSIGMSVARPTMMRTGALAAELAETTDPDRQASLQAQLQRLRRKGSWSTRLVTWLLVAAAASMAVARYMA